MGGVFEWTQALDVGVLQMNEDHKKIIRLMNVLYEAYMKKANFPELQQHMSALTDFTVKHFKDEEAYLESIQFPGTATHKLIHQDLLAKFADHRRKFEVERTLDDAFFNFLRFWLSAHIRGIDAKYGEFAKTKKAG